MCRGKTHNHGGSQEVRCSCCDPATRRSARREKRMRDRGFEGAIDEDYASATVAGRSAMASGRTEATHDPSPTVRTARARASGLTPDEVDGLAEDDHPEVRAALAANPDTDPDTLDVLADDETRNVRTAVARHPAASPEALAHMAERLDRRRDIAVAQTIARHPNTPTSALEVWIASGTAGQAAIARHALAERCAKVG